MMNAITTTPACAAVFVPNGANAGVHLATRIPGMGLDKHSLCMRRWSRRATRQFDAQGDCQECRAKQEALAELPARSEAA